MPTFDRVSSGEIDINSTQYMTALYELKETVVKAAKSIILGQPYKLDPNLDHTGYNLIDMNTISSGFMTNEFPGYVSDKYDTMIVTPYKLAYIHTSFWDENSWDDRKHKRIATVNDGLDLFNNNKYLNYKHRISIYCTITESTFDNKYILGKSIVYWITDTNTSDRYKAKVEVKNYFSLSGTGHETDSIIYRRPDPVLLEDVTSKPGLNSIVYDLKPTFDYDFSRLVSYDIPDIEFAKISNISGVFGLPYQFLPLTDPRISGNGMDVLDMGYEYADKIVRRMPLLFLSPGRASFMKQFSKADKKGVLAKLINLDIGLDNNSTEISDLIDRGGRYYTFEYAMSEYYSYVNPMCRVAAILLGIGDEMMPARNGDRRLKYFNWEAYTTNGFSSLGDLASFRAIPFYVDSDKSINESFSNGTTESQIANSYTNQVSDLSRELQFLLGTVGSAGGLKIDVSDTAQTEVTIQDTIRKLLGGNNFLSKLTSHVGTIAAGGKLIFPEIWSDSNFSRSYSCKFRFISPDPSKLSIYLNVLVPLFHLLGLVAPQQSVHNVNGYVNPFIIRAIYQGMFNIDMGIITGMNVTKGDDCQWTVDGLPTSIEVSIDIKDLYQALSITKAEGGLLTGTDILNNTALMDYISNMCGINIYKPSISRTIDLWTTINLVNRGTDLVETGIFSKVQDKLANIANSIYNNFRYSK